MLIQQTSLPTALLHRRHHYLPSVLWSTKNNHFGLVNCEHTYMSQAEDQTGHEQNPEIAFLPLEIITRC